MSKEFNKFLNEFIEDGDLTKLEKYMLEHRTSHYFF